MKAAMLREWQTVNQAGLSPHEMHCHQYLGMEMLPDDWVQPRGRFREINTRWVTLSADQARKRTATKRASPPKKACM